MMITQIGIEMVLSGKVKYYSSQHQSLRYLNNQLKSVLNTSTVTLNSLSQLEVKIVKEAFRHIAKRGNEVLVTFDQDIYTQDLERMRRGDGKVYLLCDEEGNLQDMTPLLPFVSTKRRREYEALKSKYLSSE